MKESTRDILLEFAKDNPKLAGLATDMVITFARLQETFASGGTLYICGNGGSCSDAEHIAGELLKSFKKPRMVDTKTMGALMEQGVDGATTLDGIEGGLPVVPLTAFPAFATAYANDCDGEYTFAQLCNVLMKEGDALLTISTSGNSKNCVHAARVAKAKGGKVLFLGGGNGGVLQGLADASIIAPETQTYKVQECHLPIYHCLCAMLEEEFF